ncbi:hypothetical protein D3C72_2446320 [compost metagenome]
MARVLGRERSSLDVITQGEVSLLVPPDAKRMAADGRGLHDRGDTQAFVAGIDNALRRAPNRRFLYGRRK